MRRSSQSNALDTLLWSATSRKTRDKVGDESISTKMYIHPNLLLGGFCYFDSNDELLQVNSLSFAPGDSGVLFFDGPFDAPSATLPAMTDLERMQPVSLVQFLNAGVAHIGWINSNEGGKLLADGAAARDSMMPAATPWESGAFLCALSDGGSVFFRAQAQPSARPKSELTGLMRAIAVLQGKYQHANAASARLEEDLQLFYRSEVERWLRVYGLLIPMYFALGILAYGHLEGWNPLDAIYFLVATVTTVGYGDYSPATRPGRLLTCFYAPLGTVVVMSGLVKPVQWVLTHTLARLTMLANWIERLVLTARRCEWHRIFASLLCCKSEWLRALDDDDRYASMATAATGDAIVASRKVRLGAVGQYVHAVLGPLLFLLIGSVVGYFVHGWDMVDSLYWAVVSTTTIGYGDLLPSSDQEKLFAAVFLPLATAALVSGVNYVTRATLRINIIDTNYRLVADKLLVDAAEGNPDATLTREQFLLHVLEENGLLDDEISQAVNKQYDSMLAEYNASSFGQEEPRETVDARTVYYHLKQQGRIVTDSFDAPAEVKHEVWHAKGTAVAMKYRVRLPAKSTAGVDSKETYALWRKGRWAEVVGQQRATVKIASVARGKIARAHTKPSEKGAVMC